MTGIPTPDEITADWWSQTFAAAGIDVDVRAFQQADVGTGQVGRCIRYEFEYAGDAGDAPLSVVAKFSSDDPTSRDTGQALGTYRTEVNFYNQIAPQVGIRVPRCYFADIDDSGRDHLIVMQDMSPAKQGDQIAGCGVEVVKAAVSEIVGLQAPTWRDNSWYELLGRVQDGPFADMKTFYNDTVGGFVERYASVMKDEHIRFIEAIGAAETCPMFEFHGENFALEHYDFRLDNVMIDASGAIPKVTTVDWQSVRVGKPLNDVAYFIGSALSTGARREAENEILRDYHAGLLAAGVTDYDWETCYLDYRKGVYAGFAVSIISPVLVVRTERGDKMFTTMAERYAQMALDLGAEEFLG